MNTHFSEISRKDLFKGKLNGEAADFGLVKEEEYPEFISKLIYFGMLQFFFQKEHQGTLANLKAHKDFTFSVTDESQGSTRGWAQPVKVKDGDYIMFSEIMLTNDYMWEWLSDDDKIQSKVHKIFVDYDIHRPEIRQKFYRKYDFGRI